MKEKYKHKVTKPIVPENIKGKIIYNIWKYKCIENIKSLLKLIV